ncbi:MAG: hypothetical protein FD141_1378 [Fusobacteria bacterium]|nr:MAG: hypothetical protein FD141_1378 [Fusobacteriota bacterium]KAF0230091.1 MAG: hypothetical protein FD182_481 [Fusobacteriota bacterium]
MKHSKYYILGIIGSLLTLYYAVLILNIFDQEGLLMLTSGLISLLGLITMIGFKRAKNLAAALFLISAISNLVINNSIFTAILPGVLGFILIIDRKPYV